MIQLPEEEIILPMIKERNRQALRNVLESALPSEAAHIINELEDEDDALFVFQSLPADVSLETFEYLDLRFQKYIMATMAQPRVAQILNEMSPDDRTSLLEELEPATLSRTLSMLNPEERAIALKLLGYPEYSVGRLMTPDFISVRPDWYISDVLNYIRKYGKDKETLNIIYVVDESGRLLDDIKVREFLLNPPDSSVSDLMDYKFNSLLVTDDQESVIDTFRKFDSVALPVIDSDGRLLGIVTFDDALEVAEEEGTEDMQKIGGVEAFTEPYLETPIATMIRKRAGWLVVLFIGESLTASAMGYFEKEIEKAVILALFIPLIISSGGNTGSQAATLIIRGMTLGEVSMRDWWRVVRREFASGIILGILLGSIGFARVALWSMFSDLYGPHWFLLGVVIFFSLVGVVLWGTLTGSTLPLILKKLGFDPATSSAPFVATLIDVTGLVIYFTTAMVVMRDVLL